MISLTPFLYISFIFFSFFLRLPIPTIIHIILPIAWLIWAISTKLTSFRKNIPSSSKNRTHKARCIHIWWRTCYVCRSSYSIASIWDIPFWFLLNRMHFNKNFVFNFVLLTKIFDLIQTIWVPWNVLGIKVNSFNVLLELNWSMNMNLFVSCNDPLRLHLLCLCCVKSCMDLIVCKTEQKLVTKPESTNHLLILISHCASVPDVFFK